MVEANILQELSEVIQSSNINFLLGAGVSTPYLPLLGNIEKELNAAIDEKEREAQYKKYFEKVMLPNKQVVNNTATGDDYSQTKEQYNKYLLSLSELVLKRKSTILSKQINIFTTNIDILIEKTLEELLIEYNDGFSGKFEPIFSLANYKKSIQQRSLHFDHVSEIPTFNIIKIHGSLTWKKEKEEDKIKFSHSLDHFDDSLLGKTGENFTEEYKKILVVNPEASKHLESVLNLYYSELLRMYSSELEKENATLFVLGFSMEDKHIKEITLRAAKANPTLRVFICCSKDTYDNMVQKMEVTQHPNVKVLTPEKEGEKFTLNYFTDNLIKKMI